MPFTTTWVDLEGIRDKDKYCMLPLTCGIKKKQTSECNRNELTDPDNKLVVAIGRRKEGAMQEEGVKRNNCYTTYVNII